MYTYLLRQMELSMRLWPLVIGRIVYSEEEFYSTQTDHDVCNDTVNTVPTVSYICHHLFAGETMYGKQMNQGIKWCRAGSRWQYAYRLSCYTDNTYTVCRYCIAIHLACSISGLIGEYESTRSLVCIIWPLWFYSHYRCIGHIMIKPYYS